MMSGRAIVNEEECQNFLAAFDRFHWALLDLHRLD